MFSYFFLYEDEFYEKKKFVMCQRIYPSSLTKYITHQIEPLRISKVDERFLDIKQNQYIYHFLKKKKY